jgi:hypothetical protein
MKRLTDFMPLLSRRAKLANFANFQPQCSPVVNQWRTLEILDNNQTLYLSFFKALKINTHTTLHHPVQ